MWRFGEELKHNKNSWRRTQASLREAARARASHQNESAGALSVEGKKSMVRYTSNGTQSREKSERRNVGGRDGGMKERRRKGHGKRGGLRGREVK